MSLVQFKNRLRQKAVVRVANKPWKTLKKVFYFGVLFGAVIGYFVSYFYQVR